MAREIATNPAAKANLFFRKAMKKIGRFIRAASEISPPKRFCLYNPLILSSIEASERKKTKNRTPKLVQRSPVMIPQKKYLSFINSMC